MSNNMRRWMVTGVVASLVSVALPSLAGAVGDAHVSSYIMKDPVADAVAIANSTLQPAFNKVLTALAPTEPSFGTIHFAMKGWTSQSNGIEDLIEIGAFPHTIVDPTSQVQAEVLESCKSATGVPTKKTTVLKKIPGSKEAQCVNKKGVRLLTAIGWSNANVLVLDLVTGTTKSVAQKWSVEQFNNVPASGIVVETPTPMSSQYAAATEPMYKVLNVWLLKFQAWADANGTAAEAAPFDHPLVEALNTCAAKLSAGQWSSAAQPKIDAAIKAINVLSTHINNLALATPATAGKWGKVYGLDESTFLIALTTAQRVTR